MSTRITKMQAWLQVLTGFYACSDAMGWLAQFATPTKAWKAAVRSDWMFWLLGKTILKGKKTDGTLSKSNHIKVVKMACRFARLALPNTTDPRVLACIETVEAWTKGKATLTQVSAAYSAAYSAASAASAAYSAADSAARSAAYSAAYSAASAARSAASAARSAADSAASAARSAASAARSAARSAASAAYSAADSAADSAAYSAVRAKCCEIIREFFPDVPLG